MNISNNINRVYLNDYSDYQAEKSHDGGCYGFWERFDRCKDNPDMWEKSYGTTSEMDFCPVCGDFADHREPWDDGYTCGDFEKVSTNELEEIIAAFEAEYIGDDNYSVEYK